MITGLSRSLLLLAAGLVPAAAAVDGHLGGRLYLGWGTEIVPLASVEGGTPGRSAVQSKAGANQQQPITHAVPAPPTPVTAELLSVPTGELRQAITHLLASPSTTTVPAAGIYETILNNQVRLRQDFHQAKLSGVIFPGGDASAKAAAGVQVLFLGERPEDGLWLTGGQLPAPVPTQPTAGHRLLANSFRLDIDGVDTGRVSGFSPVPVIRKAQSDAAGQMRDGANQLGPIEPIQITVTLPAADSDTWTAWYQSPPPGEKTVTITWLAADLKTVELSLVLGHVGLLSLERGKVENRDEGIPRLTATLYADQVSLADAGGGDKPGSDKPGSDKPEGGVPTVRQLPPVLGQPLKR